MFNWIKNLFGLKQEEPKVVLDTTTNWPFTTADKPAANDPAPVTEAKPKAKATKSKATAKPKATATKKAAPKTASKKPAAIKATPAKRGRKPKTGA